MDKKINCLIVDDEPFARDLLQSFAQKIPYLQVIAVCENAFEAADILQSKQPVDVLITDIQMPQINGMELIKSLPAPPQVIITTAHPDYAVEGFELGVADYLLKPVSFERFFKAINRVNTVLEKNKTDGKPISSPINNHLFIKDGTKLTKILFDDILYIEGLKDFISIITVNKKIVTYMRLKDMEEMLPHSRFLRVHKSYIVNLTAIKAITGNSVEMANTDSIIIAKQNKPELIRLLGIKAKDNIE